MAVAIDRERAEVEVAIEVAGGRGKRAGREACCQDRRLTYALAALPSQSQEDTSCQKRPCSGDYHISIDVALGDVMSVVIDWRTLTEGPDGARLAETIRAFVHDRFQQIPLPKLIRSVKCHDFSFGTVAPEVELKDICDPLPDFYETGEGSEAASALNDDQQGEKIAEQSTHASRRPRPLSHIAATDRAESPTMSLGTTTPGIMGATSNRGYFHLPLSAGLSGTNTPLAAVAGAHYSHGGQLQPPSHLSEHHHADSFSSNSPPPTSPHESRPASRDPSSYFDHRHASVGSEAISDVDGAHTPPEDAGHDVAPEDLQVVCHVTYNGDIKLSLTAEVFLDYPMPSFVGIPLKLNITGLTFDGVGILAYIKKRAHLCFLAPDDAEALVGGDTLLGSPGQDGEKPRRVGALLEDIKIESEMGETDSGRQVLKNVGKIEKFVLEQVQRIFEDEFVYPSFWTFLV